MKEKSTAMELKEVTPRSPVAIRISNAYKKFKSNVVFENLNMTVPEGIIYGLLGPSGSGKTTLMNCIVGQIELDSGHIETSAEKRSDIGYMPQATSLHDLLTVHENILFFGFLLGMSRSSIQAKADELVALLDIPDTDRPLVTLSGGQKRRVAVAITLLHDPKMLIMDEPTVGLDPVLSQCIWNYLVKLAAAGKSILITTHYIQETKQAHMIGLMRNGVLLAEESPVSLMNRCFCDNLEEAFLKLTQEQEMKKLRRDECKHPTEKSEPNKNSDGKQFKKKIFLDPHEVFSWQRFRALMYKNLMLLKGDIRFIIFLLILPMLQLFVFNLAIGSKPKNLQILVINDESSCTDSSSYRSCILDENSTLALSCLYLDILRNQSYNLVNHDDLNSSLKEVSKEKEKTWAILHFNKNFSKALSHRIDFSDISENEIADSFLEAWIDYSNQYVGAFIKYDLGAAVSPLLKEILFDCNLSPKLAYGLVGVNTPIYGTINGEFLPYSAASFICLLSMLFPSLAAALYVQEERTSGLIERMTVSGAKTTEILASIALTIFGVHIVQTIANLFVMFVVFSNVLYGSLIAYTSLQFLVGSTGIFLGFVIALLTEEVFFLAIVVSGVNVILSLTTGMVWPTEAAHSAIQFVNSYLFPLADSVVATRSIATKNYSFSHPAIVRGYVSLFVWNSIYILLTISIIKIKKNVLLARKVIR